MKTIKSLTPLIGVILAVLLFSFFSSLRAEIKLGINFTPGFPQNDFKKNIDRTTWGGTLNLAYRFPRSVLSVGTSLTFMIYGKETRHEFLSPAIPEILVDVTTTNTIFLGHLFVRLQPQEGIIRPYFDALAGLNYITTYTSIDNSGLCGDMISSNNYDDTVFSYGAGGGVMLPLLKVIRSKGEEADLFSLDLDIGFRFFKGGVAEYLKKGSIIREPGHVFYEVYRSSTDLFTAHFGLSFSF